MEYVKAFIQYWPMLIICYFTLNVFNHSILVTTHLILMTLYTVRTVLNNMHY